MAKQFKKAAPKIQKVVKKVKPVSSASSVRRGGQVTLPSGDFVAAVGRRKASSARVRLYSKSGDYVINGKPLAEYFAPVLHPEARFLKPFQVTGTVGKFAVAAKVVGSGTSSQLDAVVLGIARALLKVDEGYRPALRQAGLLTRDPRMKESRKPNTGGKARRTRQSPKR